MSNEFSNQPKDLDFTTREYIPSTSFIDEGMRRFGEEADFVQIEESRAIKLKDDSGNYQKYNGVMAILVPLDPGSYPNVELRQYEDGEESVFVSTSYVDTRFKGLISAEFYEDNTYKIKMVNTDTGQEVLISPEEAGTKLMRIAQRLYEAGGLAAQRNERD